MLQLTVCDSLAKSPLSKGFPIKEFLQEVDAGLDNLIVQREPEEILFGVGVGPLEAAS